MTNSELKEELRSLADRIGDDDECHDPDHADYGKLSSVDVGSMILSMSAEQIRDEIGEYEIAMKLLNALGSHALWLAISCRFAFPTRSAIDKLAHWSIKNLPREHECATKDAAAYREAARAFDKLADRIEKAIAEKVTEDERLKMSDLMKNWRPEPR